MKVTMVSCFHSIGRVLLFGLLFVSPTAESDGIDPLLPFCKTVGGGSYYVGIGFCVAALGSDKRTRVDDTYESLASIAVDLLTANVTSTAAKIDSLLQKGAATSRRCLLACKALYKEIAARQPGCAAAIKNGRFKEAQANLQKSASAAKVCEAGFRNCLVASPVTVENDNAFELAKLADGLLIHA